MSVVVPIVNPTDGAQSTVTFSDPVVNAPVSGFAAGFANSYRAIPVSVPAMLQQISSVGATWFRCDIGSSWAGTLFADAPSYNIKTLLLLTWTTDQTPSQVAQTALSWLSQYPTIAAVEVGNECNAAPYGYTGAQYMPYLQAVYSAVKSAHPNVLVGSSGIFSSQLSGSYSLRQWITDCYSGGLHASSDWVGVHPYCWGISTTYYSPGDPSMDQWSCFSAIYRDDYGPSIRTIMSNNGDSSKPIWVTEFGAPAPTAAEGSVSPGSNVTPANQADTVSTGLGILKGLSGIGPCFIYEVYDEPSQGATEGYYGLWDASGNPKPAVAAFQSVA